LKKSKVFLLLALFVVITLVGIKFAANFSDLELSQTLATLNFTWTHFFIILGFNVFIYFFESLRYYFLGLAFGEKLPIKTCLEAVTATLLFAWLTPGSALGAPAGAYILHKRKIETPRAIAIAMGRSGSLTFTTITIAVLIIFSGIELPFEQGILLNLIYLVTALFFITLLAQIIMCFTPYREYLKSDHKIIKGFVGLLDNLSYLIKNAKLLLIPVMFCSFMVNFLFACPLIFYSLHFNVESITAFAYPLLYFSYSMFLPTPGGSALAEVSAAKFFTAPITPSQALAMVIISRLFTYIFQIIIGVVYLFYVLGLDHISLIKKEKNEVN
jgi:uncharacterized protein (TIRG00374 family)